MSSTHAPAPSPDDRPTPEERLLVALDPSPDTHKAAARAVANLAAELGDVDLVDMIASAAENPEGIPFAEVGERAGVTYRQLDYWTRQGYLSAMPRAEEGSGNVRSFHPREVVKARIMGSLVSLFTMSPGTASQVAEQILVTGSAEVGGFKVTRKGLTS